MIPSNWYEFALLSIAQVSLICLVTSLLIAFQPHHPARRYSMGMTGLLLLLAAPLFTFFLPVSSWRAETKAPAPPAKVVVQIPRTAEPTPVAESFQEITIDRQAPLDLPLPEHVIESEPPVAASSPSTMPEPLNTPPTSRTAVTSSSEWNVAGMLSAIWLLGATLSAMVWFLRSLKIRRLIQRAGLHQLTDEERSRLESVTHRAANAVGLTQPPSLVVSQLTMPFVVGMFRATVYVPANLLQADQTEALREVLIHEFAHVVRRDGLGSFLQRVATLVWWWHPLVQLLGLQISRSREEICDNYVLNQAEPIQYAETLFHLASTATPWSTPAPVLNMIGFRWTMTQRIRGMIHPRRNKVTQFSVRFCLVMLALLGGSLYLIGGVRAEEQPATAKPQPTTPIPATLPQAVSPQLQSIRLHGKCLDDRGDPLPGVTIQVLRIASDFRTTTPLAQTISDEEGRFEFADIETAATPQGDLMLVAALAEHASAGKRVGTTNGKSEERDLVLAKHPVKLTGFVSNDKGTVIPGATVYVTSCGLEPIPGIWTAVTDANGRYEISDLRRWNPEDTATFDKKTGVGMMTTGMNFYVSHPDYPLTTALANRIPNEVNVTLTKAAIVEGTVIDDVTGKPVAGAPIMAQGIARDRTFETTTDADGRYQLRMTKDHYNIWSSMDEHVPIAVKNQAAVPGQTIKNADIHLVTGGFIIGKVYQSGEQLSDGTDAESGRPIFIAHYGPARPKTGAAVTSVRVNEDGTYRLRVAPGGNYVYSMTNSGTRAYVHVPPGAEVTQDIHLDETPPFMPEDDDDRLARYLRHRAQREDAGESLDETKSDQTFLPSRLRPETPTGKLLDQLEEVSQGPDLYTDRWAKIIQQIVELGPDAIPELSNELSTSESGLMQSCCAFALRAIGDPRAIPVLIQNIPRTLRGPSSDMGLRATDPTLTKFMQQHDLDEKNEDNQYGMGRPVREVFGALQKLTGQKFDEETLYGVFDGGTSRQRQLKRDLYQKSGNRWAAWWKAHAKEFIADPSTLQIEFLALPELEPEPQASSFYAVDRQLGSFSNHMLAAYQEPTNNLTFVFEDLDTGRRSPLPEKWKKLEDPAAHEEEIVAWATEEGYDLMGTVYQPPADAEGVFAIKLLGGKAWELSRGYWNRIPAKVNWEGLAQQSHPVDDLLLHFDQEKEVIEPKAHAPFMLETSHGTRLILNVGVPVHDDTQTTGGVYHGDNELNPVGFRKGRRFGGSVLVPATGKSR
ncbi:carboxypeptidase regulatory-like domain-containing protein [Bremerella cremea]|uniref:carboxypeptidase regulatory-like domain-containing protein n=1 Tax=Bremerella cremea TaxID=1031537 RepID=UPI0031EF690D